MSVRRFWIGTLVIAVATGFVVGPAAAQEDRIDGRGREMAVYPPARHFDHQHMRLEIDIPDMEAPSFRGRMVLTVEAIGSARDVLELDAAPPPEIVVERVSVAGQEIRFEHGTWPEGSRHHGTSGMLRIELPAAVEPGQSVDVEIEYTANYPAGSGDGLTWSRGDPEGEGETDRYAQIHSQGQPQHNHRWFPCHDFPNERLTTELIVTVEDPYIVGSNGRLVSTRLGPPGADGRARSTWHWSQEKPHPNYLVSLVVGRFSIVALPAGGTGAAPVDERGRRVACYLLAPVGSERTSAAAFAKTPAMLAFFGEMFGHPYPWAKYSQALVRHFAWGGMENTSATTLREEYAWSSPGEEDDLIAHEAAHQWTGNLLTCKSWEHLWLNEGWASYCEALWAEHEASSRGAEAARGAYQRKIASFVGAQRALNRTTAPRFPAMVSNRYMAADENFIKPNDVYAKGAVVLHMLRQKLGDEAFFAGVRLYIARFAYKEVETDDFRRCLEEASGLSLERFFEQWCYRPGLPRLDVEMEWVAEDGASAGELRLAISQVQHIDADNPAYALSLPVHIRMGGETIIRRIEIDTRRAVARFDLPERPRRVIVDPDIEVAAFTRVTKRLEAEREAVPAGGAR